MNLLASPVVVLWLGFVVQLWQREKAHRRSRGTSSKLPESFPGCVTPSTSTSLAPSCDNPCDMSLMKRHGDRAWGFFSFFFFFNFIIYL